MFQITANPIEFEPLKVEGAGGFVYFEGKVRNHADGRPVNRLEYEAEEGLAVREGNKLIDEAIAKFGIMEAKITHRTGILEIGETAVLIQVASAHRREAFAACEWLIDELKLRVPLWKKEHYADGISEWIMPDSAVDSSPIGEHS